MKLRPYIQNSDKGSTVLEFLVAMGLGVLLLGMALATFLSQRRLVKHDVQRTAVQQQLKSTLDIIGMNIRLTGENLPSTFPAIELVNNANGDELILRRNLLDEVLKVCDVINASSTDALYFGIAGTTPGCIHSDQTQNYNAWSAFRTAEGGTTFAYVYDPGTQLGEFFSFNGEVDNGVDMYLTMAPGFTWTNAYGVAQTAAYILEEWHFALSGDVITLVENQDSGNTMNVTYGISNFQVDITMQDGSTRTSFGVGDDWTDIASVQVVLSGVQEFAGTDTNRQISASFLPRNILSN